MRDIISLSLSTKISLLMRIYDRRLSEWSTRQFDRVYHWRLTLRRPRLRWPINKKLTIQLIYIVDMLLIALMLMVAMANAPR